MHSTVPAGSRRDEYDAVSQTAWPVREQVYLVSTASSALTLPCDGRHERGTRERRVEHVVAARRIAHSL